MSFLILKPAILMQRNKKQAKEPSINYSKIFVIIIKKIINSQFSVDIRSLFISLLNIDDLFLINEFMLLLLVNDWLLSFSILVTNNWFCLIFNCFFEKYGKCN